MRYNVKAPQEVCYRYDFLGSELPWALLDFLMLDYIWKFPL